MTNYDIAEIWDLLKKNNIPFVEVPLILKFKQIADDTQPLQKERQAYLEEVKAELSKDENIVFSEKAEVIVSYNIKTFEVILYAFKSNLILDDVSSIYYFQTVDLTNLNFDNEEKVHLEALEKCKAKTVILKNAIVKARDIRGMFAGIKAVKIVINNCQFPNVTDMQGMFSYCIYLKELKMINTTFPKVENASRIFGNCMDIESIDISFLEKSHNLKDISGLFNRCNNLENIKGLDRIDTSKVEDLNETFKSCYKIKRLDLSTWETNECKNFKNMFMNCKGLEYLNIKQFVFNAIHGEEVVSGAFSTHSCTNCEVILDKKLNIADYSDKDIAAILRSLTNAVERKYDMLDVYEEVRYSDNAKAFNRIIKGIEILVQDTKASISIIRCKDKEEYNETVGRAKVKAGLFNSEFMNCSLCSLYISNEKEGKVVTVYTIE